MASLFQWISSNKYLIVLNDLTKTSGDINVTGIDYVGNPNQRTPCVLVLDTSGSMTLDAGNGRSRIEQLNEGLHTLQNCLQSDPTALTRVQLAIVTVGGPNNNAEIMMDLTDANHFDASSFQLSADNTTPLGEGVKLALEIVEQGKANLKSQGISYTRPWIFVISDGEPTDADSVWHSAAQEMIQAQNSNKVEVFVIGVGGANMSKLEEISIRPALELDGLKFDQLFVWLSSSLSAASRSRPGDKLELSSTDPWRNVGI